MELVKFFRRDGALPDLLIIGAMKSGTTTLFELLCQHPGFLPPRTKEIQFFNIPKNFERGERWYRAHFPSRRRMNARSRALGCRSMTGEATPAMSMPAYAGNAACLVPNAYLVVTLRNPVDRAWSHYQHMRRHARPERLPFDQALEREFEWRRQGLELTPENHRYMVSWLGKRNYIQRGHYAEQLAHWLRFFPREQFLVLNFDRWKHDPPRAASRIAQFVGLPPHEFTHRRANAGGYREDMPPQCRERLVEYYRPHNRRLFDWLGEDWGWPC